MTASGEGAGTVRSLAPGDIVAIETTSGTRHVQVTHARSPHPDVIRAIRPGRQPGSPEEIARGETAFVAMVELRRALENTAEPAVLIGHATVPAACRGFPSFGLPIRDRAGEIVYWWRWDGESLNVATEATDNLMPLREVLPAETLRQRLADLTA